jgi:8-oxo-dGTP pyrophosphatase MutT (NUDIX family)
MMLSFDVGTLKFNYRVAGIIFQNGKVLFQRTTDKDFWFLPGGRVEFLETAEESLKREMIEEFNLPIEECNLICILENFFELNDKHFHEIGLYFTVKPPQNHHVMNHLDEFTGTEEGYLNKWIPLEELNDYNIYPEFLKEKLLEFNLNRVNKIEHIINKSGKRN